MQNVRAVSQETISRLVDYYKLYNLFEVDCHYVFHPIVWPIIDML